MDPANDEFLPQIDLAKCTGCALCARLCPRQVLGMIGQQPVLLDPAACDYSGYCEEHCPTGAISLPYQIVFL